MTYQETIEWMYAQLPMFQNIGSKAYKIDLTNILKLSKHLNNPEKEYKTIHIGGTNGKGSTSSMIASILQEAGYKVALFTSPHLKNFRERIKINGEVISEQKVIDFIKEHQNFIKENQFSFFELTFALAISYFAEQKVDVAVIEVGLGGRLDSTNIISPVLSVITNIGLDHQNILGNTLQEITYEKAGIIKPNTAVVIGEYLPETKSVFIEKAKEVSAPIWFAEDIQNIPTYESDLKGSYQQKNIKTTYVALNALKAHFNITEEQLSKGFQSVVQNTKFLGRWQVLNQAPLTIADTAHNEMGIKLVLEQIKKTPHENLFVVFGMVNDKDCEKIVQLLPKNATYFLSKPNVFRGLEVEKLAEVFKNQQLNYSTHATINDALKAAQKQAQSKDIIYIGGSTFVVAEVL